MRRVLGRGGFGVTYLAVDERDGGQVAVKEYFPVECAVRRDDHRVVARSGDRHEDSFRWGLDRFRDEGRVLGRFNHPSIVRVITDFEANGTGYIVMIHVDGETLSTRLAREGPLDEEESLAMVLPIVDGLEQVHAAGYLHRDIKPANVVIGAGGAPVLLDFGAARRALSDRTRSLTAVVSDGYAPIEQYARDSRQGPWTDIYALGAVLYRCLTNRAIPEAPARAGADDLVPATEASPYRLSAGLQDALGAALAVRAADRPPTLAAWRRMFGRSRPGAAEGPDAAAHGKGTAASRDGPAAGAGQAGTTELSRQRQRLVDWVRRQLIGPAAPGRLLGSPVERYPTGVLHPVDPGSWGVTGLDPAQSARAQEGLHLDVSGPAAPPPDDEEDDSPVGPDGTPGRATARPVGRRRYVPPSSVGVTFYVRGDARLRVTASAASYRRVRERAASGRFATHAADGDPDGGNARSLDDTGNVARARYERTPFECGLVWPETDNQTPDGMRREVRRRPYREGDVFSARFSEHRSAAAPESERVEPGQWDAQLDVRRRPYGDGHILTVVFANRRREAPPGADRAERRLFEARLECVVESGELAEYPRVDPALLTDEEQEIELRYRDVHIYAVGHGAAADWLLEPGRPSRVWSEYMPAVDVPVVTTEVAGLDREVLVMHDIAGAPFETILDRFDAFVDRYDEWVGRERETADQLTTGEQAAVRICAQMDAARQRMRAGVALLRRDADAALAFRLANRAMLDQMRQRDSARGRSRDAREYRWRPFQLAFLLAVITSTIDERDPSRDMLDLIWFPTGGGKTEAYLGLFAFLVVWRRLRHGEAGGGTAVLM
ncbi:MAG: protein kinase, partial [Acidobacteriota bacterium]|nr:protein kinase [Acidobacteriota bacterium]